MSKDHEQDTVTGRRDFLKGATLTAGAAALAPVVAAANPAPAGSGLSTGSTRQLPPPPNPNDSMPPSEEADPIVLTSSGGDFMVDVFKTLDLEYMATMCASTFRGLHESVINYGDNSKPEILTCPHEEIAVAIAHGYAKMAGKPIATIAHGTVGLQHASMALYNAWCDRAPIYMLIGNIASGTKRLYDFEWQHSAQDCAATVRDYLKWDDQPTNLQSFAESAVRAHKIAMTPPMGPVLISLDQFLQEGPITNRGALTIPKLTHVVPPVGDPAALDELARMLVAAEYPVIVADRLSRTPAAMGRLIELAEVLQCGVIDKLGRLNFPTQHPLRGGDVEKADLVLTLEVDDVYGTVHILRDRVNRATIPMLKPGAKLVTLGCEDLFQKSNYQDFQRYDGVDLAIAGDAEDSLPILTELVKKRIGETGGQSQREARGKAIADAHNDLVERTKQRATIGWDSSPISTARMCAELYHQISGLDWSLVGSGVYNWPHTLWNFDKSYRWNGDSGGSGIGYLLPGALGGALANKAHGRFSVCIQPDGDFNFVPSTLWTAAHHRIPILYIMHNNRAYHMEYMYLQAMANRRQRGIDKAYIGTTFRDPYIDYATVAKGFGVHGEGPITDPKDLAPAIARAVAVVQRGEPALIDVVTDPR